MDLMAILQTIIGKIIEKLIEVLQDRPNLVKDKNIEGTFRIGEYNGLYGILELPFRISNIGKKATTINYLQLFILDNKRRRLSYGFNYRDIDKTINPSETFKIELGKIIYIKDKPIETYKIESNEIISEGHVGSRGVYEVKGDNITKWKYQLPSLYMGSLTSELFAGVLVITPHGKWHFEIPLIMSKYKRPIEDYLKIVDELDKNFEGCSWNEFK